MFFSFRKCRNGFGMTSANNQSLHFLPFLPAALPPFLTIFFDLPAAADFLAEAFLGLEAEVFLAALGFAGDFLAGEAGLAGEAATGAALTTLAALAALGLAALVALGLATLTALGLEAEFLD
jgi:hypothetical protein